MSLESGVKKRNNMKKHLLAIACFIATWQNVVAQEIPFPQRPIPLTPTPNPSRGEGSLKSLPADNATYKTSQTPLPSGGVGGGYLGVWLSLAASLLLLFTLGSMWYGYERQNECVAYVYGERVTDRELVMHEMHTAMTSLAADDATATMEQQMKELFAE